MNHSQLPQGRQVMVPPLRILMHPRGQTRVPSPTLSKDLWAKQRAMKLARFRASSLARYSGSLS